jgi:hypothetical protein
MSESPSKDRRAARTFRPALQGPLEERVMLSVTTTYNSSDAATNRYLLNHPASRAAYLLDSPEFLSSSNLKFNQNFKRQPSAFIRTANGGQSVVITTRDGSRFRLDLNYISNTDTTSDEAGNQVDAPTTAPTNGSFSSSASNYPQAAGKIRAYAMPDGKVGIILDGTNENTELTISEVSRFQQKGYAHSYAYGDAYRDHLMNVGQITVNTGQIGSILGFHTATLSGPLISSGTTPVNRIAFQSILPGASIAVGGDLDTLDVYDELTLDGGTGIQVGRDLNLLNVGSNLTLNNGASVVIGRDLGLVLQPPKGTGTGSNVLSLNLPTISGTNTTQTPNPAVSAYIQGSINIGPASSFIIGRYIDNTMFIQGSLNGTSRFSFFNTTTSTPVYALGGTTR